MVTTQIPSVEYETLLRRGSREKSTVTIRGVMARKPAQGIAGPKGCTPILWCFCVHDSPSSPCPCMGPIIWLPDDRIFRVSESERPGQQGEKLVEVEVASDALLLFDETREIVPRKPANVRLLRYGEDGKFSPVEETLWVQEYMPMRAAALVGALELIGSNKKIQVMAKKKGPGIFGWIVGAFKAGWEIGEFIDDKTGVSDSLADWLYDTLGPWDELF